MELRVNERVKSDPFANVWLEPMEAQGKEVPRQAVMIETNEGTPRFVAAHSPNYKLVPNQNAWDMVHDILDAAQLKGEESRIYWNGKKFLGLITIPDFEMDDPSAIQPLRMGIEVVNSYDGTLQLGVRYMMQRLVCSNGLYVSQVLGQWRWKHLESVDIDAGAAYTRDAGDRFLSLQSSVKEMGERDIDLTTVLHWHEKLKLKGWTDSHTGKVLDNLKEHTVWGLLNAYTYVTSHHISDIAGADLSSKVCDLALQEINA